MSPARQSKRRGQLAQTLHVAARVDRASIHSRATLVGRMAYWWPSERVTGLVVPQPNVRNVVGSRQAAFVVDGRQAAVGPCRKRTATIRGHWQGTLRLESCGMWSLTECLNCDVMRLMRCYLVILICLSACAKSPSPSDIALATKLAYDTGGEPLSAQERHYRAGYIGCGSEALSELRDEQVEAALKAPGAPEVWAILGGQALAAYVRECRKVDLKRGPPPAP